MGTARYNTKVRSITGHVWLGRKNYVLMILLLRIEFRVFVEAAERQLLFLFKSIDRNGDGRLGKEELRNAFKSSGLTVPSRRLDGFFNEVDMDHDGYISFDEWRYVSPSMSLLVSRYDCSGCAFCTSADLGINGT